MNKKAIIVVVLLLLGVGGYFFTKKSSNSALTSGAKKTVTSPFTSIQDALSKSLSLQCTFTNDQGQKTKTYIKAGAVRVDYTGATADESGGTIVKDKKIYSWTNSNKEGFMMERPDVKVTTSQTTNTVEVKSAMSSVTLAMLEKYKDSCKPGTVADSLFTPPSDIKFTDYSNRMKELQKTPPPSGGAVNEESLKNMMEKYGKDQ